MGRERVVRSRADDYLTRSKFQNHREERRDGVKLEKGCDQKMRANATQMHCRRNVRFHTHANMVRRKQRTVSISVQNTKC